MARSKTTDKLKKKPEKGENNPTETQHHSLVAQLRRERGTADSTPLPPPYERTSQSSLTPTDEHFQECLKTSYQGFVYQTPDELEDSLHTAFEKCFQDLEELYLYDAVQAEVSVFLALCTKVSDR
ncbi:FTO catalytic domain [Fragilaria crotonensis]|nr:FTO catalytic domain [Fragilaria crotonensis]